MEKIADKTAIDPARWVDQYGDYLFHFAGLRISNRQVAEDLVQETFLSALKALGSFRGESNERTWLTSILKRKIIDYYRKSHVRLPNNDDNEPEFRKEFKTAGPQKGHWEEGAGPQDWGRSPAQLYEDKEFRHSLELCLEQLPERLSGVFVLREVDGLSSDEICKLFNISPSNLWVILHRARHHLRKCMEITWLGQGGKKER